MQGAAADDAAGPLGRAVVERSRALGDGELLDVLEVGDEVLGDEDVAIGVGPDELGDGADVRGSGGAQDRAPGQRGRAHGKHGPGGGGLLRRVIAHGAVEAARARAHEVSFR